jgi:transposase
MTLAEIKERLREIGIKVGQTAISNFLRQLDLTYKKCMARPRSASMILDLAH